MYPMLSGLTPLLRNGTAMTFRTRAGEDMPVTIFDDGAGMGGTVISVGAVAKIADRLRPSGWCTSRIGSDDRRVVTGRKTVTA